MQSIVMGMRSLLDIRSSAVALVRQQVACEPCVRDIMLYYIELVIFPPAWSSRIRELTSNWHVVALTRSDAVVAPI